MPEESQGQVVTFYSYQGGTGRTMALANVAWILAAAGRRVLVADWNLDSPGLHRFFRPFIDPAALASSGGLVEMVRRYERATTQDVDRRDDWHRDFARVGRHAFAIDWPHFPGDGMIDFLAAGSQDQNYARSIYERDWDEFYERYGGGQLFDALRADMKRHYDYALIDSRTGWSDVAGICTVHMPDVLVDCFTLSEQGIEGAAEVATNVSRLTGRRAIRILPVPMRVDLAEKRRADAGRLAARRRFGGLPGGMTEPERDAYWATVEVPYQPYYAYEETLATFADRPGSRTSMLAAYEVLTGYLTEGAVQRLAPLEEPLRERIAARFVRPTVRPQSIVALRHAPEDRLWAEWIARVLEVAGIAVELAAPAPEGRSLTVISSANAHSEQSRVHGDASPEPLAVYVADIRPLSGPGAAESAFLAGQSAEEAVNRLLALVGHATDGFDHELIGLRYPGRHTSLFNAPVGNVQFTGRENDLIELRARLAPVGHPVAPIGTSAVALQGMGGVGKTQLAMEYAHRFRNAYDVVWWINADPVTFVDTQLFDLGRELGLTPGSSIAEDARAVLSALSRGDAAPRWLMIFDNAEDIEKVAQFLPSGPGGHVIITSRDAAWAERAAVLKVDVFDRRESVAHLRQRVPTMRTDDAARLAEELGDLPIAVAAAGAWLADTGQPVDRYLGHLEQHGPSDLQSIWDLSLRRLEDRSPAAHRLLQLCSVLAAETALDLIYSDRMAELLYDLDPLVVETMYRGALVQQINRLALLKLDAGGGRIQVHRILQRVVRQRMTSAERDRARREVQLVLAAARPPGEVDDPANWPRFQMIWPHLEVARVHESAEAGVRQLIVDRLRYIWLSGDFHHGRRIGEDYVRRWEHLRDTLTDGPQRDTLSRQLLHLRFNLANIVRDQAEFETSRQMDEAILAEQQALLGNDHPLTLVTAGGLGSDLRALGHYAEARKLDEQTLAAWLELFGEDHPCTLVALDNLAASLRASGDFRAARDRTRQAYARATQVLGPQHTITLVTGGNLGRDLREAGEYEESVTLLREILARHRRVFGDQAPRTLSAMTNLAVSERHAGRAAVAADLLEVAYENLNQVLGPTGTETLVCRLSRAVDLVAVGELASAQEELTQVERRCRDRFGDTHPYALACVNNLATVARAAGDLPLAQRLAAHAADAFETVLGVEHPYTMAARTNQAIFLAEWGRVPAAYELLTGVAERIVRVIGPEHPDALRCTANLVLMRRDLHGAAPEEENEALQRLSRALGATHPAVDAMRERRYLHRTLDLHPF